MFLRVLKFRNKGMRREKVEQAPAPAVIYCSRILRAEIPEPGRELLPSLQPG